EAKTVTFGMHENADIYPTDIEYAFDHTSFTVHTPAESARITVNIPGKIYLYNSLATIATAICSDIPMDIILKGCSQVENIKWRLEFAYNSTKLKVVIDFVLTKKSLIKAIDLLRPSVKYRWILVIRFY